MKKILKIILIGIIAAVTYKYLNERDIDVSRHLQKAGPLLERISEKVENLLSEIRTIQNKFTGASKDKNETGKEQKRDHFQKKSYKPNLKYDFF